MAFQTYFYRGGSVDQKEIRRVVDGLAVVSPIGMPVMVKVTIDSSNKEALDDEMAQMGFTEDTTFEHPLFRRTLEGWNTLGIAASASSMGVPRWGTDVTQSLVMRSGWLLGVAAFLDMPAAGAALTVTVFVDGVASALSVTIPQGSTQAIATINEGVVQLAAGARLELRVSTSIGWTSINATLSGEIEIEN